MIELVVVRLADMTRVHPHQIEAKCALCDHAVAVFPSGQEIMRTRSGVVLVCQVCKQPGPDAKLAPGAEREPYETRRKQ